MVGRRELFSKGEGSCRHGYSRQSQGLFEYGIGAGDSECYELRSVVLPLLDVLLGICNAIEPVLDA